MSDKNKTGVLNEVRILDTVAFTILSPDAGAKEQKPVFNDDATTGTYINWGETNDWPKLARIKLEKSTSGMPLVNQIVEIVFGRGFTYWIESVDDEGKIVRSFKKIDEIDNFFEENDIEYFLAQRLMDLYISGNIFCEVILRNDLKQIVNLNHLEAEFCRFGAIKDGEQLSKIYYSGLWPANPKGEATKPLDFLPRNVRNRKHIQEKFRKKKFVIQSHLPSPGRTVYAFPPHGGLFRDKGWLDYGNSVPEIMNSINDNAWNIKYHIEIPFDYWERVNKNWDNLDDKARKKFIDDQITLMKDWLSGKNNAGKSFITHFAVGIDQKPIPGLKFNTMEDKIKKDDYLTSVQESDIQIARAYGVDSSLANIQPQGGKMGAGSGSDKRTGFENMVNTTYVDVMVVTEPIKLAAQYNEWPKGLKFGFIHDIPTTLNEDKSGVKTEI